MVGVKAEGCEYYNYRRFTCRLRGPPRHHGEEDLEHVDLLGAIEALGLGVQRERAARTYFKRLSQALREYGRLEA
jgi:hypothetical protein